MTVSVSLLYGGLNVLLVTALGANVSRERGVQKAGLGQVPEGLVRPVRAHGNAAEWTPLALVGLLLLELSGVGSLALHLLGGGFLLGRVLHAAGVLLKVPLSAAAAGLNYLTLGVMGGWALWLHFAA